MEHWLDRYTATAPIDVAMHEFYTVMNGPPS